MLFVGGTDLSSCIPDGNVRPIFSCELSYTKEEHPQKHSEVLVSNVSQEKETDPFRRARRTKRAPHTRRPKGVDQAPLSLDGDLSPPTRYPKGGDRSQTGEEGTL